jgi:spore germination protein YaaH
MPADKLIMGVPYYGYDYLVYEPAVKAETRPYGSWRGTPNAKTYEYTRENIDAEKVGWDDVGKVGWKAYYVAETDTWRMIFLDDERSLRYKYEFAKNKNLQGVGMWALGFDNGESALWALLREQFGVKLADGRIAQKQIKEI